MSLKGATPISVLLVEDHVDLAASVGEYLEAGGIAVDFAYDGLNGAKLATAQLYDVIVLDINLPLLSGFQVCEQVRLAGVQTPVIMLTARDQLDDKIEGFDVGADDYLVKPFAMRELEARIFAQARRARGEVVRDVYQVADLVYNHDAQTVSRAGSLIRLPPICIHILAILMRESPNMVSREKLEHEIWGDLTPDSDTLRSHLYNLRKRIDKPYSIQLLHTFPGVGYRLCLPEKL